MLDFAAFGMAPKTIARISRFHLAVAAVQRVGRRDTLSYAEGKPFLDGAPDYTGHRGRLNASLGVVIAWADLALGCGYYDQSYFINEFRFFSGLSPLAFLQPTRQ